MIFLPNNSIDSFLEYFVNETLVWNPPLILFFRIKLSALELSIYDLLMGSYAMTESPASQFNPNYASFMINQKNCIEWFRVENPELFEALTAIE